MNKIRIASILTSIVLAVPTWANAQTFTSIGTGGLTGVYYPTGGAICRLVNKGRKEHNIRCSVESTGGSIFNLNVIQSGELDFGVVQSDWQYHAYNGSSKFKDKGANKKLRAVFSIHSEPFTLMARQDSGIKNFSDLKGKKINIGNPGSGQRGNMDILMQKYGWTKDDFALASELKASEQSRAMCDNKIDAITYTVGHPNASIKEASTSCDTVLVPVDGPIIEKLIAENSYYAPTNIPGGMYRGSDKDTPTFGVKATLVTSTDVKDEVVYHLVKAVFDNFDAFRQLHPALEHLTKEDMLLGNSAPLHPGAIKYYQEVGLMKQ